MLWFNNNDGGQQDAGNLANYSLDAGNSVPASALPTNADDVTLNCDILISSMGSLTCRDLYLNGFGIGPSNTSLPATAVNVASVNSLIAATSFGVWNTSTAYGGTGPLVTTGANPIYFVTDPGVSVSGEELNFVPGTFASNFSASVNLSTQTGLTTFNGNVTCPASFTVASGAVFNAGFSAPSDPGNGTFNGTSVAPAFGPGTTMGGGTMLTTVFTGAQTGGAITLTGASADYGPTSKTGGTMTTDGSVKSLSFNDANGTSFSISAPSVDNVLNSAGGNYFPPPTDKVQRGYEFGVGGTGSTGTLDAAIVMVRRPLFIQRRATQYVRRPALVPPSMASSTIVAPRRTVMCLRRPHQVPRRPIVVIPPVVLVVARQMRVM